MQISFILLLIVSIFITIFALQNGETVTIDLFFLKRQMSQALVILGSVGLGAIVTLVLSTFGKIKRIRTIKALNKKIKILEDEKASFETKTETLTKENEELQKINSDLKVEVTELETAPIEESQEKVD
jgi:uncharacterized integral membrane protein